VDPPLAARPLAVVLALLLALAAGTRAPAAEPGVAPSPAEADRLYEKLRAWVDAQRETHHWSEKSIDRNVLLEEVANRVDQGQSEAAIETWLQEELAKRRMRFAPLDPEVPPDHRYALPFDRRVHWIVSARYRGYDAYALDFAMPEGTEVRAARGGSVARVVDGFRECGLPEERDWQSNTVTILHDDGSFAVYAHLQPGVAVVEGASVAVEAPIGRSGCTGDAAVPHLHFEVAALRAGGRIHSLPIRFEDGSGGAGYFPEIWSLYQNRPLAELLLRVTIAGTELSSGQPFPVSDPSPVQLHVEVVTPEGSLRDATSDPGTRYVALTPWSLTVDAAGRVTYGQRKPAWAALPDDVERGFAIVTILHRDPAGREGFFDAWLTLPASATSPAKPPRR